MTRGGGRGGARAMALALACAAALVALAAPHARGADRPTVLAAASLGQALRDAEPEARHSFAGSNTLAMQIRQGAPADVFASAGASYTRDLHREGLVERPRLLALNRLALIVPRSNPADVWSAYDLDRDGLKLVVAGPEVPVGAYTRTLLESMGLSRVLENVVSEEDDVKGVAGKVALGEADAGFVYATDVAPISSRVRRLPIPLVVQPPVRYELAVVRDAPHPAAARAYVERMTGPHGRSALAAAGFALPPAPAPGPRRG